MGFQSVFGEYTDEIGIAMVLSAVLSTLVIKKPYRNWKLYKKIKGEKAERASERLEGPEHPKASIFPDIPPEDEPKE